MSGVSVGCEHELADISLDVKLPKGYGRDARDYTIVNSNGIANDPTGVLYRFGGEINTPPTSDSSGQVAILGDILRLMPNAKVNYRSNLHVHVRWPGLKEDLKLLKRVQSFIHMAMPRLLPLIEPIPKPDPIELLSTEEYKGAVRRYKRRRVSHQTLLTSRRLEEQLKAKTIDEFFRLEVPASKKTGQPMWHMQPRLCVNLRQLLQTDTVEFRHFPGTLNGNELRHCVDWCSSFLTAAIEDHRDASLGLIKSFIEGGRAKLCPKCPPYQHWQELRYRATCHDGSLTREQIAMNIKAIEAGVFDRYGRMMR
jgi:hypothetical protein